MKELTTYITEKLKINKNSIINQNFKKVTDKIAFMCGWPSAGKEDNDDRSKFEFDGEFTETHLEPEKDVSNAYIAAIYNWVHSNHVNDFDAYADHFELESVESNRYVVKMFKHDPKLVEEIVYKMTSTLQLINKHVVNIDPKYKDDSIYMFTDENTLIWCDVLDKDDNMIERIFVKKD